MICYVRPSLKNSVLQYQLSFRDIVSGQLASIEEQRLFSGQYNCKCVSVYVFVEKSMRSTQGCLVTR